MTELKIKPLSVNEVWQGRRFKTPAYTHYEAKVILMLPRIVIPPPPFSVTIHFGMSLASDIDNPAKPFIDCLQKKYGINDKHIHELILIKEIVKKGNEFIKFKIEKAH